MRSSPAAATSYRRKQTLLNGESALRVAVLVRIPREAGTETVGEVAQPAVGARRHPLCGVGGIHVRGEPVELTDTDLCRLDLGRVLVVGNHPGRRGGTVPEDRPVELDLVAVLGDVAVVRGGGGGCGWD